MTNGAAVCATCGGTGWYTPRFSAGVEVNCPECNPGLRPQGRRPPGAAAQTTVRHVRDGTYDPHHPEHVYIGRANQAYGLPASRWANPFPVLRERERRAAIARYRAYLLSSPALLAALPALRGKTLYCWCAPKACHGDVLAELANAPQAAPDHPPAPSQERPAPVIRSTSLRWARASARRGDFCPDDRHAPTDRRFWEPQYETPGSPLVEKLACGTCWPETEGVA